ncbi:TPA: DDE-type integrase/transposase/recombinase [Vibrio parahaemolyticus]|uniref:DDE-type integrase/transposase/recombinase n=1 Tax=Vibrio atypicus TaxID=558271 RepID=UPI001358BD4A|nr:DDE-type integrase/transposase/recombinase [Vibrio vulnificus]HAS6610688.1 DDE-type integrase/transposase/recombinase [Vibrio parahaemolyticus]HAS6621300.1 DDE-type integrase/transposase/recombinase [Vibrio parahaemolyticus]HAS6631833.1 DDE-type integrase/transposase/recombinase [Vibrio parahaemolyticus]HAS6648329.1 DDE-type integrase/transposase/recombinase [Vibrio parahaemolyticus]
MKVKGEWLYNYRAEDKFRDAYDYYFNQDEAVAKVFLSRTTTQHELPEKVVVDGSKTNCAAIDAMHV